jgi:hypothetical protein
MKQLGLNGYPFRRTEAETVARIMALQSTLGWIAPMATRPVFVSGPVEAVQEIAPTISPRKRANSPRKLAKSQPVVGEQFYDAWMAAVRALRERHERWDLVPGAWQWCTLLPKQRRFTTAIVDDGQGGKKGGVTLKWAKDQKLPAPRYWAGGVLPAGVVVVEPIPPTLTPWVVRPWGKDGAAIKVHPMLARLDDARTDQIAADRPLRAACLYRDALDKVDHARDMARKVGPYYAPEADRRANYRKAIAAAWALRAEVRALRT